MIQDRHFIELPALLSVGVLLIRGRLPLPKFFEHAHLPVGLDQSEPAAFAFGLHLIQLPGKLSLLYRQDGCIAVRVQKRLDVGRAGRLEPPRAGFRFDLQGPQGPLPLQQHLLGAEGLGQVGAALVALPDAQAKQGF
jgi:hypothetical protein